MKVEWGRLENKLRKVCFHWVERMLPSDGNIASIGRKEGFHRMERNGLEFEGYFRVNLAAREIVGDGKLVVGDIGNPIV